MTGSLLVVLVGCGPSEALPTAPPVAPPTVEDTGRGTDAPWIDEDRDGWSVPEDCNDANQAIYPGAPRDPHLRLRGVDFNCDGLPDYQEDFDGDGWTEAEGDCDDHDPEVYPGAPDVMDGVDTNCDGTDGVGEAATLVARGTLHYYGYGSSLLRADVDGDGCDDLVYTESGFHTRSVYSGRGESLGLLHARLGCTRPAQTVSLEDPTVVNRGIGAKLRAWPAEGRDLIVSCTSWRNGGGVAFLDFLTSPPTLRGEILADYPDLWVDACAVLQRKHTELIISNLDYVIGGGPAHGFLIDPFAGGMPSVLDPDRVWWPYTPGLHIGGKVVGYDRTGDGRDELLTYTTGQTLLYGPPGPGALYVLDRPGLAWPREVWHGDASLGSRFGAALHIAPGLPAPGDRGLLVGGETIRGSGALWVLPPVLPGEYTLDDAAFEVRGEFEGEWFGLSARVGDVNGDGHADIVVGAPWRLGSIPNHPNAIDWYTGPPGKVYVFLGPFDGSLLTRADARVFVGGQPHEAFGWSVELADLNGDGTPEIYVGAPSHGHLVDNPLQPQHGHDGALYRIDL